MTRALWRVWRKHDTPHTSSRMPYTHLCWPWKTQQCLSLKANTVRFEWMTDEDITKHSMSNSISFSLKHFQPQIKCFHPYSSLLEIHSYIYGNHQYKISGILPLHWYGLFRMINKSCASAFLHFMLFIFLLFSIILLSLMINCLCCSSCVSLPALYKSVC